MRSNFLKGTKYGSENKMKPSDLLDEDVEEENDAENEVVMNDAYYD